MPDALSAALRTDRYDLGALQETSRLLSASLDRDFILGNLLLTAMSKTLVTRGVVLLHDEEQDTWCVAAARGGTPLDQGTVIASGPIEVGDGVQGDEVPEVLAGHGIGLVLPLRVAVSTIGLLALGPRFDRQPFDADALRFLRTLVSMTTPAVQNSLAVDQLKRANRELDGHIQRLRLLFDLSQQLNATTDRTQHARLLGLTLMGQMAASRHLFIVQRPGGGGPHNGFTVVAGRGVGEDAVDEVALDHLCQLQDVLGPEQEEWPDAVAGLREHGIVLFLPLQQQGQTCGVLGLGPRLTGQSYSSEDRSLLEAIGALALSAIRNSFLLDEQIEKQRMEEEMQLARTIQQELLPETLPEVPGVQLAAVAEPAREVGGDYFDAIRLGDGRLLLAIADVTGKGVGAALLMANVQACLHALLPMPLPLEDVVAQINRVICQNTSADRFITFFAGVFDPRTQTFDYVNAGHNPPMLVRGETGAVELLEEGGLLLGVMAGMPYGRGRVELRPGDTLALFTDGVTEAMGEAEEEFGEERLEALLTQHRALDPATLVTLMRREIADFTGSEDQLSDDLTAIMLRLAA